METRGSPSVSARNTNLTPKAIIHQKFGTNACYTVEEVQESTQNGCPGLAIPQKGPFLYRCRLELPEFSVVSDTFRKKKDAEQSAAEMALRKVCCCFLFLDCPQYLFNLIVIASCGCICCLMHES